MNPTTSKLTMCCTLIVGAGLWAGMAQKFNAEDELSYEPNVACVKGSPYGKVLALAMQGPVDFYWHEGKTHEDEAILAADDKHAEGCGCGAHEDENKSEVAPAETPLHMRAKQRIKEMAASAHRKTDGKPLSRAHQKYLQSVTEDKLSLAYELDPSNYTNYGNYHLFLATNDYGKGKANDSAAVALAQKTLSFCKRDERDPSSWLTAASAAYNIIFHIGRYHDQFTIPEAKASLAEFDFCIKRYSELRNLSIEEGRILSEARLEEMDTRVKYLGKLRQAQGVYMKRMMSTKMANTSTRPRGNN